MATREGIPVLTNHNMTVSDSFTFRTSTNYSVQLQASWTGLSGIGKFAVQASLDGSTWSYYPLNDCGTCQEIWTLQGATDNLGVKINRWSFSWIKIVYDANTASAGTINVVMSLIDNQDVSHG